MTEQKSIAEIKTCAIYKLHPKLITIGVKSGYEATTTVNLPITNDVYIIMLRNLAIYSIEKNYPLVFFINEKGTVYDVLPLQLYKKRKADANKTTENTNNEST
jgi:hypothetical protein